jgi:hypothetical protein
MKRVAVAVVVLTFVGVISPLRAADNPTGTWKWETNFGGKARENTLKLKLEGDKLTGSMLGRDNQETPIENASYKDGKVSFSITREFNNNKFTTKYNGTLKDDTITGKSERERDGQTQSSDWVAKRQK